MAAKRHPLHNPNAGSYPLPSDKREIRAVLRSVDRCYDLHPYLAWRYDAYGEAFTRSDGGYLVTLSEHPQSHVNAQAFWIGEMLACRGMPRLMVEVHLDLLYEELTAERPSCSSRYRKLRLAAERLRKARCRWIAQSDFDSLAQTFERISGGILPNAGVLIAAAACDDACGLVKAIPSLMSWLADPDRFPPQWCAAAETILRHALSLTAAVHATSGPPTGHRRPQG